MSRIVTITIACAALLLTATATSLSWQVGTRLTLVTSDGARIIGVGEVADFDLRLTLSNGYSGLAVLVVEGPAGSLETFDVLVEEGGTVLLGEDGEYSDLGKAAQDSGLAYRILLQDGNDEGAEDPVRKRPATISASELAEFVEREGRPEEGQPERRQTGPRLDGPRLDSPPADVPRSKEAPGRGRRTSETSDLPGQGGGARRMDGSSGWGPGWD